MAMSLCQLTKDDYSLLNDIIIDYLSLIDDNRFNELEDYVNNNINELMWYYYRVLSTVDKLTQLCYNININKGETILTLIYQQLFIH